MEVEERESAPHQIVAAGVRWSRHLERVVREFMTEPCVVITAMEEAALWGSVQQVMRQVWWAPRHQQVAFVSWINTNVKRLTLQSFNFVHESVIVNLNLY